MKTSLLILLFCLPLHAETKLNVMTGYWETTNPGDVLKMNTMTGVWHFENPHSQLEMNPITGEWNYAIPAHNTLYLPDVDEEYQRIDMDYQKRRERLPQEQTWNQK